MGSEGRRDGSFVLSLVSMPTKREAGLLALCSPCGNPVALNNLGRWG